MTAIDPKTYQCVVIAKALELYARTGIKANRLYTPGRMMTAARTLTGQSFKPRDYLGAATALRDLATQQHIAALQKQDDDAPPE